MTSGEELAGIAALWAVEHPDEAMRFARTTARTYPLSAIVEAKVLAEHNAPRSIAACLLARAQVHAEQMNEDAPDHASWYAARPGRHPRRGRP